MNLDFLSDLDYLPLKYLFGREVAHPGEEGVAAVALLIVLDRHGQDHGIFRQELFRLRKKIAKC